MERRDWLSGPPFKDRSRMRCSLRIWLLSTSALLFVMSLLFTFSHNGTETPVYSELAGWASAEGHPVRLVPGYPGSRHHPPTTRFAKNCTCRQCLRQPGSSDWFDSHYNASIPPVWTLENPELSPDVQRWWMVSEMCKNMFCSDLENVTFVCLSCTGRLNSGLSVGNNRKRPQDFNR